jgi:hypothetical protein
VEYNCSEYCDSGNVLNRNWGNQGAFLSVGRFESSFNLYSLGVNSARAGKKNKCALNCTFINI